MTRNRGNGLRSELGQMMALMAVSIVALCAMGAFVMDVGSWFQAQRATQTVSDAAALAGAQTLPADPATAQLLANEYSEKNGGGLTKVSFSSNTFANDTISVRSERTAPGFLSNVLGISSVGVGADASARAYNLESARYAAPFGVERSHPMISDGGCPCFDVPTELALDKIGPGAFRIINIDGSRGGIGQKTLADWILNGYDGYMDTGWYFSDPGAKFNPGAVQDALSSRIGQELLFPVYEETREQGASFEYRVAGWVGFLLTGFQARGNNAELYGTFRSLVWDGIGMERAEPFFGATVVKLVE